MGCYTISLWFAVNRIYSRLFDILVEKYPDLNGYNNLERTTMVSVLYSFDYSIYIYILVSVLFIQHLATPSLDVEKVNRLRGIVTYPNLKGTLLFFKVIWLLCIIGSNLQI
jgi:hypothetical protein